MTDLISLDWAKDYNHISNTDDDHVLSVLVTAASDTVEKICGRLFTSTSYTKWLDGNGTDWMHLPQWPITAIDRICLGAEHALDVQYSGSAHRATVQVDATNVTLRSFTTTTTTSTLAIGTYTTLATMDAAIDAVSGWAATMRHTNTAWVTSDLKPMMGINAKTPYLAQLLVPDDDAMATVKSNSERTVWIGSVFPRGVQNVFVSWTGGYSSIPEKVRTVVARVVGDLYAEGKKDGALQSEKIGDYSYTRRAEDAIRANYINDLIPYMGVSYFA